MDIKKLVGETFLEAADYIEGKISGKKVKIGITTLGSEHGVENMLSAARMAARNPGIEVILIGPKNETGLVTHETECENEAHNIMEELLDKVEIDACVTMHYNFPIGVSTVGRVISPAKGRELFIATTTGTSSTDKTEAMVKNAVYGNIVAKACGIENPTVGILNVDGAKAVERALKTLAGNGYGINFGTSGRADGGILMRGNDLLTGSVDVMVCDSLTGNILMKMFSSFSTGGSYEATGFGYGPGVGFGYERKIMIVSRASGAAVVKGAIEYAADLVRGNYNKVLAQETVAVKKAKFDELCEKIKVSNKPAESVPKAAELPKEIVTYQISGMDVMDLDDAVEVLKGAGIYAESGMGCTGPIVLVNEAKGSRAAKILLEKEFISQ
ncbi:MAG: glycine/sarcosine/betaine reductase complex component C subunit alpha [Fusobacteriaceae bacterium]